MIAVGGKKGRAGGAETKHRFLLSRSAVACSRQAAVSLPPLWNLHASNARGWGRYW